MTHTEDLIRSLRHSIEALQKENLRLTSKLATVQAKLEVAENHIYTFEN